jgi:hypothetical protein
MVYTVAVVVVHALISFFCGQFFVSLSTEKDLKNTLLKKAHKVCVGYNQQ